MVNINTLAYLMNKEVSGTRATCTTAITDSYELVLTTFKCCYGTTVNMCMTLLLYLHRRGSSEPALCCSAQVDEIFQSPSNL